MTRLALGLAQRGHAVVCAFHRPAESLSGPEFDFLREAGVELVGFDLAGRGERARFRRWCKEGGYQIVHAHRDEALVFAWQALLGLGQPRIIAGRGTDYRLKRFSWARTCFRSRKVRRVIAVAQAVKEALVASGVPRGKIEVVYGGVDENVFRPGLEGSSWRAKWGVAKEAPLIGNVAALVGKKGHPIFFQAAALVRRQFPAARFVCVGEGSAEKFTALLDELALRDAVVFAGYQQDMPHILSALDVVVCSSVKGEGLNGAIREGMSCGRPVVATDVAGNREIVHDGENGVLVGPGDEKALAEAIVDLLRDQAAAQRLGEAARETICRDFTNAFRCARIEDIYQSVARE